MRSKRINSHRPRSRRHMADPGLVWLTRTNNRPVTYFGVTYSGRPLYSVPIASVPTRAIRRRRQRQSIVDRDVYGVPGRHFPPQIVTDHIASLGIYSFGDTIWR